MECDRYLEMGREGFLGGGMPNAQKMVETWSLWMPALLQKHGRRLVASGWRVVSLTPDMVAKKFFF